jgi:hypothetical protein
MRGLCTAVRDVIARLHLRCTSRRWDAWGGVASHGEPGPVIVVGDPTLRSSGEVPGSRCQPPRLADWPASREAAAMNGLRIVALGLVAACGSSSASHDAAPHDAAVADAAAVAFTTGCDTRPAPATNFATAADFGPVVPGGLAGWNPDGRWFMTGIPRGQSSSLHFARAGNQVTVDRDPATPATLDGDQLFQHKNVDSQGVTYAVAIRVSNRQPDGTLQLDRAVCDGGQCRVCRARLTYATYPTGETDHAQLTLVGQLNDPAWGPGYTFNVRVVGTLAYLIRQDGLHIIETADPAHPVELGHYARTTPGYSNDVKLVAAAGGKRYALLADYPVDVVDVTDPAAPTLVAQIPEEAHTLAVETLGGKTLAYFGNYDARCPVYDVTDPAAAKKLGAFVTHGQLVHDLYVDHGLAYLTAWADGFQVVDFTNPATPTLIGRWAPTPTHTSHSSWGTTVGGHKIILHGEEAFGAHLSILDGEPGSATFLHELGTYGTREYVSVHNLMAFGAKAYFTYYQDGVRVADLSDPAHPRIVGYFNTWDPQGPTTTSDFYEGAVGLDVDLARKLIFVADSPRGLLILHDGT